MKIRRRKKNRRVGRDRSAAVKQPWFNPLRLRVVMVLAMTIIVFASGWQIRHWLRESDSLTLKRVQLEGSFVHVSRSEVQALLKPYARQSFFDLDLSAIKSQLQQQPWVRQASVRRHWPDELEIRLLEQQPVAHWGAKGLVNTEGRVFSPGGDLPEGLPRLYGPVNSEPLLLARLQDVDELLKPLGLKVTEMHLDDRRSWRIQLDNGLQLMLGRDQGMQRIQRFISFYPVLLAARADRVRSVDLRYTNGIVLQWREHQGKGGQVG